MIVANDRIYTSAHSCICRCRTEALPSVHSATVLEKQPCGTAPDGGASGLGSAVFSGLNRDLIINRMLLTMYFMSCPVLVKASLLDRGPGQTEISYCPLVPEMRLTEARTLDSRSWSTQDLADISEGALDQGQRLDKQPLCTLPDGRKKREKVNRTALLDRGSVSSAVQHYSCVKSTPKTVYQRHGLEESAKTMYATKSL